MPQGWLQHSPFTLFGAHDFVALPTSPQGRTLSPKDGCRTAMHLRRSHSPTLVLGWRPTAPAAGQITGAHTSKSHPPQTLPMLTCPCSRLKTQEDAFGEDWPPPLSSIVIHSPRGRLRNMRPYLLQYSATVGR